MDGAEARRRGQEHDVHAAVNDLLVGVQPDEAVLGRDLHFLRVLLLEVREAVLELILEGVAHRGQHDVRVGAQGLAGGAGAASAAADQPDFELSLVFLGEEVSRQNRRGRQYTAHEG